LLIRVAIGEMGGPTLLVNLLAYCATNVQLAAVDAIRELARNEANRGRIVACNGLDALLSLLCSSSASVRRRVRTALDLLAENAACRMQIDVFETKSLVEELQLADSTDHMAVTSALRNIASACRSNKSNRKIVTAAGVQIVCAPSFAGRQTL
jgi:hypothetical protein